jgi:putative oxidoreductase
MLGHLMQMAHLSELTWVAVVAARLLLAAVFLYSGQDKLRHWQTSVAEVTKLRLPCPEFLATATIGVQLVGGVSVALGLWPAVGAAILACFTTIATVLGHRFWLLHGAQARQELMTSLEHIAIVGGLLLVVAAELVSL